MQCAIVALLDFLATLKVTYRIVAIDLVEARKEKILAVYQALPQDARGSGELVVASPDEAKQIMSDWTGGVGANGVLEVTYFLPPSILLKQKG